MQAASTQAWLFVIVHTSLPINRSLAWRRRQCTCPLRQGPPPSPPWFVAVSRLRGRGRSSRVYWLMQLANNVHRQLHCTPQRPRLPRKRVKRSTYALAMALLTPVICTCVIHVIRITRPNRYPRSRAHRPNHPHHTGHRPARPCVSGERDLVQCSSLHTPVPFLAPV